MNDAGESQSLVEATRIIRSDEILNRRRRTEIDRVGYCGRTADAEAKLNRGSGGGSAGIVGESYRSGTQCVAGTDACSAIYPEGRPTGIGVIPRQCQCGIGSGIEGQ